MSYCRHKSRASVHIKNYDLSDCEHGLAIGVKWIALIILDVLVFSPTTVSKVYIECCEKKNPVSGILPVKKD